MSHMTENDPARSAALVGDETAVDQGSRSAPQHADEPRSGSRSRLWSTLSFSNISAIYIFAALFVLFSLWVPGTFLTAGAWKSLIDDQALTVLVSIGLLLPLAAGAFDLAIGTEVGFAGVFVAWLMVHRGVGIVPAIALSLAAGGLVGALSGFLIVRFRIGSFIATLGVSSILTALTNWVSGGEQILSLPSRFQSLGNRQLLGLTYPVWIALVASLIVWYVLERTPAGRRVYATGGNSDAARLAGVRTATIIVLTLVGCGLLTASAGILESAQFGVGDPTVGPSFLLPAFAAVFLGSTQFKRGRYNVWGTIVAVYTLAEGVKGLQLAGAPVWIPDLFNGVALLLAVGLASYERTAGRAGAIGKTLRRRQRPTSEPLQQRSS